MKTKISRLCCESCNWIEKTENYLVFKTEHFEGVSHNFISHKKIETYLSKNSSKFEVTLRDKINNNDTILDVDDQEVVDLFLEIQIVFDLFKVWIFWQFYK